jgi:lysine 2,3-aminomutase
VNQQYYVYICDMVKKAEHHRTPLQKMLDLEAQIRGSIAGFMMPQFVVDLPGGGGKRLACSYESYDRETGVSRYRAPAVNGREGREQDRIYEYYDPVRSVGGAGESEVREVESPPATSPSTQEAGRFL